MPGGTSTGSPQGPAAAPGSLQPVPGGARLPRPPELPRQGLVGAAPTLTTASLCLPHRCRGAMPPTDTPSRQQQQQHTATGRHRCPRASPLPGGGVEGMGGVPISPPAPSRPAAVLRAVRMELAISGCPRLPVPPGSGLFVVGPWWGDHGVVGGGNRVQQPLGSCWGWRTPPRVSNTPPCLLLVTAECTQRQTPTTTPSAPPPRTASAPW